ncbi:MAG: metal ABC transporter substrate-binding protein [Fimbriimonadaceae bacterium]
MVTNGNVFLFLVACLIAVFSAPGCAPQSAERDHGTLAVLTSISIVEDLVREVGGEKVEVTNLIPAGVDPHTYKPVASDLNKIEGAKVVVFIGRSLEGRLGEVLAGLDSSKVTTLPLAGVDDEDTPFDIVEDRSDPHIWMDPAVWANAADSVAKELAAADPENASYYEENAKRYRKRLSELTRESAIALEKIPSSRRVLITPHDSFRYFGQRFNIRTEGLQGLSTATEASAARVKELSDLIAERKIPAVFYESTQPTNTMDALAKAARAKGIEVKVAGPLYTDSLGPADSGATTYLDMFRKNVQTIVQALQ